MRRFRGVLLDVDGTLVDSVDAHALAWHQAFADHDHDVRVTQIKRLIGMGGDKLVEQLTGIGSDTRAFEQMSKRHDELFAESYLPKLRPFVGARQLVLRLRAAGYHIAIASSAHGADLAKLLKVADIDDLVAARATASDVERTKPDPDILDAALAKLPVERHEAVMIGDSPYDIEAASRAGIATIGVATNDRAELAGAIAIYSSITELLATFESSPLG